ncbi:hypothetical protein GCM10010174_07070 [Kutzneria viridogrisea]|uniref:Uncharacterized protein n=1 Tax=Kutzneria viridogrisea TaxID=47990 RepID=A0ABR6BUI1_9PSEU|nr:hypothetical protein [Kutzneria viridogrisea]
MNRAHQLLAEWDARVTECGGLTKGEARKHDEITELRTKLAERTRERTDLHRQLDAAATAIAALHHDNTLLRQELDATGILVTLDSHRPRSEDVMFARSTPRRASSAGPEVCCGNALSCRIEDDLRAPVGWGLQPGHDRRSGT